MDPIISRLLNVENLCLPKICRLNAYYECVLGSVAVKNEVYAEYLATCSRYAIKNALNSTGFSDCIK